MQFPQSFVVYVKKSYLCSGKMNRKTTFYRFPVQITATGCPKIVCRVLCQFSVSFVLTLAVIINFVELVCLAPTRKAREILINLITHKSTLTKVLRNQLPPLRSSALQSPPTTLSLNLNKWNQVLTLINLWNAYRHIYLRFSGCVWGFPQNAERWEWISENLVKAWL